MIDHLSNIGALSACGGFLTHALFIRGEWHMQAPLIALLYLISPFFTFTLMFYLCRKLLAALSRSVIAICCYNSALFGSIFVYRIFFHPLRSFPGPFGAKVTKWWQVSKCGTSKNHLLIDSLHRKYGEIVRTGPNEVTVCHPDVMPAINGSNTCIKAPVYDLSHPLKGINLSRDFAEHHRRRRIWDPAFTVKAMTYYADRIAFYGDILDEQISQRLGQPLLANDWFLWFSFDVIGDLALSRDFNMLHEVEWQKSIKIMKDGMAAFGTLFCVPWFCRIAASLQNGDEGLPRLLQWCRERMDERMSSRIERKDIAYYLIEGSRIAEGDKIDMNWLYGDGFAIITAGSETIGETLIFAFYELARRSKFQEKIFEELRSIEGFVASVNKAVAVQENLRHLQYLNGFIKEILRIHPAVPTSGYRVVGSNGIRIRDTLIPPGTTISGPRYSLGRSESCFESPTEVIPERWYASPDLVKDKRAFSPFSMGQMNCIGQNLAMIELRYVIALLVGKYWVSFAPGEDGHEVETDLQDCFSAVPGELKIVFSKR